jgi:hypothetical protein
MTHMNTARLLAGVAIGLGATLTIDLWALLLKRAFAIPSLNYCFLGRWVLHMPEGKFAQARIAGAPGKPHECKVGWTTHYLIGVTLAVLFVSLVSPEWMAQPTLPPALVFGVVTVLIPFFTIQPAFGLGVASSKMPHPNKARLKSVMTHTVFGIGLWLWARLLSGIF